jgi:hypothetical protein
VGLPLPLLVLNLFDATRKNKENFGRFGQYEAGMDYLLGKARDTINKEYAFI